MKTRTYEIILSEEEDDFINQECDKREIVNSLDLVSSIIKDWIDKEQRKALLDKMTQENQDNGFYE